MSTPAANNSEHIRFLVSCIRHATGGKVDFDAVRLELDIVSKAAAAKRYERLLKAHSPGGGSEAGGSAKKRKAPAAANGEAKKAKAAKATGKKSSAKVKQEEIKVEDTSSSDSSDSAAADINGEEDADKFEV